ncbi:MAG: flagellar hook-associated protein FlgL [Planctomycetota bacterium]
MPRITQISRNRMVLADIQAGLERVVRFQDRLASGKRVQVMSDDPASGRRALLFRIQQFRTRDYGANIERSLAYIEASDQTFGQMSEVLDEAKELAVQGANGTQSAASRQALATSVDSLLSRTVDLANTVHDGRFIFAGTEVGTRPFALDDARSRVHYEGNLDEFSVAISPSASAPVNQNGHTLFKRDADIFAALIDLRDALNDNDAEAVSEQIATIDAAHDRVSELHGALGGRMQRLELTRDQLERADARLGELVSQEVDVDMAETVMHYQNAQVALEAGLNAGARVMQPSLLDYL